MMDLTSEYSYTINAAFREVRKGDIPINILHGLVEQFAECPDVMAVVAATSNETSSLGAMVIAFVAGCRYAQVNKEPVEAQGKVQ